MGGSLSETFNELSKLCDLYEAWGQDLNKSLSEDEIQEILPRLAHHQAENGNFTALDHGQYQQTRSGTADEVDQTEAKKIYQKFLTYADGNMSFIIDNLTDPKKALAALPKPHDGDIERIANKNGLGAITKALSLD